VGKEDFVAYVQPNIGYGVNMHRNAASAYDVISEIRRGRDWGVVGGGLEKQRCGPSR
jgi:hypothetical protein